MEIYSDKEHCCGCGACYNVCPKQCISMEYDKEGFLYPVIDEKICIKCNLCKKTCPYNLKNENNDYIHDTYACINKNRDIVKKSTSGGVFSAIAEEYCIEGSVIFGATLTEDIKVKHIYIDNVNLLDKLRGSKYVQSEIGDTYKQTKDFLIEGKKVVFSGTPCQIAGLKSYLKREYENLLTIDLVCHGVPSPLVFNKYKEYMEKKFHSKIININFRDKKNKRWDKHKVTIDFENNKTYSKRGVDDSFEYGFYKNLCNRPSCHSCPFSKIPRVGDFTLGDFWGIEDVEPTFYDNEGTSLLLVNSKKAQMLIEKISTQLRIKKVDFNKTVEFNKHLITHSAYNPKRDIFMNDFVREDFEKVRKKYLKGRGIPRRIASVFLGKKARNNVKRLIKKIK